MKSHNCRKSAPRPALPFESQALSIMALGANGYQNSEDPQFLHFNQLLSAEIICRKDTNIPGQTTRPECTTQARSWGHKNTQHLCGPVLFIRFMLVNTSRLGFLSLTGLLWGSLITCSSKLSKFIFILSKLLLMNRNCTLLFRSYCQNSFPWGDMSSIQSLLTRSNDKSK